MATLFHSWSALQKYQSNAIIVCSGRYGADCSEARVEVCWSGEWEIHPSSLRFKVTSIFVQSGNNRDLSPALYQKSQLPPDCQKQNCLLCLPDSHKGKPSPTQKPIPLFPPPTTSVMQLCIFSMEISGKLKMWSVLKQFNIKIHDWRILYWDQEVGIAA